MLAGSIADSKLLQITTAGKVATNRYIVYIRNNSNCCSFNSKYNCWNEFDIFVGALTDATALAAGRNFWNR
jgi:hypothetical protein